MSATEQFTLLVFLLVNQTENVDVIHKTTGDWINLAQLSAVWILWVLLYGRAATEILHAAVDHY